jgi:hypothetical protein
LSEEPPLSTIRQFHNTKLSTRSICVDIHSVFWSHTHVYSAMQHFPHSPYISAYIPYSDLIFTPLLAFSSFRMHKQDKHTSIPQCSTLHLVRICQHTFRILISYSRLFLRSVLSQRIKKDKTFSSVLYGGFIVYCTLYASHCTSHVLFTITLNTIYNVYTLLLFIYSSFFNSYFTKILSLLLQYTYTVCLSCTLPLNVYFHPRNVILMFKLSFKP